MSICNPPFTLKEIDIIGGDYQELIFRLHDATTGAAMNVEDLQLNFSLVEYKNRYGTPLITRNCEPLQGDNTAFIAILYPDDTKGFAGKYVYQITVKTPNDKQQSFQGVITIDKNINPDVFSTAIGS